MGLRESVTEETVNMRIIMRAEESGHPAEWGQTERLWLGVQQFPPRRLPWGQIATTIVLSGVFAVGIVYLLMRGVL
jgi:hypothetical protein